MALCLAIHIQAGTKVHRTLLFPSSMPLFLTSKLKAIGHMLE